MDTLDVPIRSKAYAYLENVSWKEYEALLRQAGERPIRFTYDRGRLEIMTLSHEHEFESTLIDRFIGFMIAMLNIRIKSGGSNTMKQELLEKGLEPDKCYWIKHEPKMRHKKRLNLDVDPPPDLVAEVDVSRSVMNRMKIYAAMRVPEVWRWRKQELTVFLLGPDGKYAQSQHSECFPFVPMDKLQQLFKRSEVLDETALMREFMAFIEREVKPRMNGGRKNGKRMK